MILKNTLLFLALSAALTVSAKSHADSEELLDILKNKGVLTDDQYQELRQESREKRRVEALEKATVKDEREKSRQNFTAKFKDGLTLENADGSNSISIGGRLHTDYRSFSGSYGSESAGVPTNSANQSDTFDVRRARIELKGKFQDRYEFLVSADLASPSNGNTSSILDQAYVNYKYDKPYQFRFGQFKMPMNLEKMTSSNQIDFMERGIANQLAANEDRGMMFWGVPQDGITYAAAISTGEGAKNRNDVDTRADSPEYIARGTVNFAQLLSSPNNVVHLGVSGSTTTLAKGTANGYFSGTNSIRTEARGINFFTLPTINSVAGLDNTIDRTRIGLEAALAHNNFKLQSEWIRNNFQGKNSGTASFDKNVDSYYVEGLWIVTGERYADFYKDGAWGTYKPSNNFDWGSGGRGLWEVGIRYSKFDASDWADFAAASGGAGSGASANVTRINLTNSTLQASSWTAGVKWVMNPNTRVMLNYVRTNFDTPILLGTKTNDTEQAVMARVQWNF